MEYKELKKKLSKNMPNKTSRFNFDEDKIVEEMKDFFKFNSYFSNFAEKMEDLWEKNWKEFEESEK